VSQASSMGGFGIGRPRASGGTLGKGEVVVRSADGLGLRLLLNEAVQAGLAVPDAFSGTAGATAVAARSAAVSGSGFYGRPLVFGMTAVCSRGGEVYWVALGHVCSRRRSR
jgi:hypothetical protein